MNFYIETTENESVNPGMERLAKFTNGKNVYADLKDTRFSLEMEKGINIYLYGDIFYHIRSDGEIKLINSDSEKYLKKVFSENNLKDVISNLEGQYIGICVNELKHIVHIFSDRYARLDSFYAYKDSNFYLSSDLDAIFKNLEPEYDQKMLAHIFSVYGCYTPKGLTIYKNIKQLRVGEIITLSSSGINSEVIEFKALEIEDYTDKELEVYYEVLRAAVISRANCKGEKWVSSSSGWDSSIILGILVNEFGSKNVRMLTGIMNYSEKTEALNRFEIDKVGKIGNFYGIKPVMADLDFVNKTAPEYWEKCLPYYKSRHMYTYVTYNFTKLSDKLRDAAGGKGQVIFNGESADSFHNFGFSQFNTFFHNEKSFTEYADKMNCYLYGPSFLKNVINGSYESDKVFQIFSRMMDGVEYANLRDNKDEIVESYLFPFIYGSPRIPFAKTYKNPAFTEEGQKAIYKFPFREYMPEVLSNLSENNIYSWLIYLYHSFHAQGSTVNIHKHGMELNNHKWRSPFNDIRLINLLSKASEKWGRGLEFNNTKYPLKWVAKNKIKFPYELLDKGSHAYLWDVIEGFSLTSEIVYRSGVTGFFKDTIEKRTYKNILDDKYFNINYMDNLVLNYLNGDEASGKDFNNLVSLITLCITGWY
ncbi:MAG: hypothetical protein ACE5GV_01360 [Candidatus Scalindua sp.]